MDRPNNYKYIDDLITESIESLNRSTTTLEQTNVTSKDTLTELNRQGEQIERITHKVGIINYLQDKADQHIRTINTVFGSTVNGILDLNPWRKVDPTDNQIQNVEEGQAKQNEYVEQPTNDDKISSGLDNLSVLLDELNQTQIEIGRQLDKQNGELSDLSSQVDMTTYRMAQQTKNINKLI